MICPPERCAEILWRDVNEEEQAAAALRVTAQDLHELGIMSNHSGAVRWCAPQPGRSGGVLGEFHSAFPHQRPRRGVFTEKRAAKFEKMGAWTEAPLEG